MIPVDRGAGSQALADMTNARKPEVERGRQLIIFPEGTRRAPGAEPKYKFGVAHLYSEIGVPCLPVALNSGLFWPRRSFRRYPGTIKVEICDPIAPGMDKQAFFARVQAEIEAATARLVAEAQARRRRPRADRSRKRARAAFRAGPSAARRAGADSRRGIRAIPVRRRSPAHNPDWRRIFHAPAGCDAIAARARVCRHIAGGRDRPDRPAPKRIAPVVFHQRHVAKGLDINLRHLLALRADRRWCRRVCRPRPERNPAAGAAAIEPEHEARPLRRSAMHEGIDAERTVQPGQPRRVPFEILEARPPHQRAIGEHPQVAGRIG